MKPNFFNTNNPVVLIMGKVWPEPESSAAGSRMMQLIHFFKVQGAEITFATAAAESEFSADLQALGVNSVRTKLNDAAFDVFIANLNPDLVLFDRFMTEEQFGWRVAEQCPDALRILDTEDLHCLRNARQQAWKKGESFEEFDVLNEIAKREIASILRCDLSLIISSYEMHLLKDIFKVNERILLHLPFMLNPISQQDVSEWPAYDKRKDFISIGNFLHEPNWNAVLYLKEVIWPLILKEIPDAKLHIYGAYPSQKVEQLHNKKGGFLIEGRAANAKQVMRDSRILLAPLRFGAGLKGKLIEAMQCGTPSITTLIGAEAMHDDFPWPGVIEDDPQAFAEVAIQLYQQPKAWKNAQGKGAVIINELYSNEKLSKRLKERINELDETIQSHRQHNFIGSILQHHTAASTRYMSKWIEAKNSDSNL